MFTTPVSSLRSGRDRVATSRSKPHPDDDNPPGLSFLPSSSAGNIPESQRQQHEGEGAAVDVTGDKEEEIPGLGSSWASQTQNEWLLSHYSEDDRIRPFIFNANDNDSDMGESGMDVDRMLGRDEEEDEEFAIEQDLTDAFSMRTSSPTPTIGPDTLNLSQRTEPASPTASPPDPLSGPSVRWSQVLAGTHRRVPLSQAPSQAPPGHPNLSQHSANANIDLLQQPTYIRDVRSGSPVPSAYLSPQEALIRAQARAEWGEKYDFALEAAYGRRRTNQDPYAEMYNDMARTVEDNVAAVSQDSRAADFAEDEEYHSQPRTQAEGVLPPQRDDEESLANPNSPYIPPRSLSSQPRTHSQPGLPPLFHLTPTSHVHRTQTLESTSFDTSSSSSFRPRTYRPPILPPWPGQVVHIPPAGQFRPRRPSDTIVPDSQESNKSKSQAEETAPGNKRKRVEMPETLEWVLPSVCFFFVLQVIILINSARIATFP